MEGYQGMLNSTTTTPSSLDPALDETTASLVSSVGNMVMQNLSQVTMNPFNVTTVVTSTLASLPSGVVPIPMFHYIQKFLNNKTNNIEIRRRRRRSDDERRRRSRRQIEDTSYYNPYYYYTSKAETITSSPNILKSYDGEIYPTLGRPAVTEHPEYGTIGVDRAKAFLKENVTVEELNKTVPFETFPLTSTSDPYTSASEVHGVVLPILPHHTYNGEILTSCYWYV